MSTALPEAADYLAPLVGRWVGEGQGHWAAEQPFRYREELTFTATGKPFLSYQQRTWSLTGERQLHGEVGYLRAVGGGQVELLVVQGTGFTEVHVGMLAADRLEVSLTDLGRTPTALPVTGVRRRYQWDGAELTYQIGIAMNGEPLADHLSGRLSRLPGPPPVTA